MIAFDVFNEPIAYDNSGKFKDSIFWRNLGYDMFVIAFQAANKAKWEMKSNVSLIWHFV
jgi:GH35 family endo-1,4-beta-xylanase